MLNPNDLNVVMNQCRIELTGVSDAMLKAQMFEVLDEFFRDTSSWRSQVTFNATSDTNLYDVIVDEGQIIRLDKVTDSAGNFAPALMADIPTLSLQSAPNSAQTYTATVIQTVSLPLGSKGFPVAPEWVLQKWHLAIKHGIIGEIKSQNGKSYSDAPGAVYHLKKFRQMIGNVRSAVLRANTSGAQAWRFPQSFRSDSQRGGVPPLSGSERTF
jgi:hypothetical protein